MKSEYLGVPFNSFWGVFETIVRFDRFAGMEGRKLPEQFKSPATKQFIFFSAMYDTNAILQ